jgi:hypothetical protein
LDASYLADTDAAVVEIYIGELRRANVNTVNRLSRAMKAEVVLEVSLQSKVAELMRKVFDAWDPVDYADLCTGMTLNAPPMVRPHGKAALVSWMRQVAPNIASDRCGPYAENIDAAGVKPVNRLRNVIKRNKMFLRAAGVDGLDAADLIVALNEYQMGQLVSTVGADTKTDQGESYLIDWLGANVPSLFLSSIQHYARLLAQCNVVTVNRLITMISGDGNWLLSILGQDNEFDVLDIAAAARSCARFGVYDLVSVGSKDGRIFKVNYSSSTCHVEFCDGSMDATVPMNSLTLTGQVKSIASDDRTIREAVLEWFTNPTAAINKFGPLTAWNTAAVTDISSLFKERKDFNEAIGTWDVGGVTTMTSMFQDAASFSQPLNDWNVSQVVDISKMFNRAVKFNHPLECWDVSKVTYMSSTLKRWVC